MNIFKLYLELVNIFHKQNETKTTAKEKESHKEKI